MANTRHLDTAGDPRHWTLDDVAEEELRGRVTWTEYDPRTRGWGTRLTTPADDFTEPYAEDDAWDWDLLGV